MIREFQTEDTEQVMQTEMRTHIRSFPKNIGVPISLWCRSNCYKQRFLSMKKMG